MNRNPFASFAVVALAVALVPGVSGAVVLERGKTEVAIAPDAPAVVRFAADEATNLLAQVFGVPVPLVTVPRGDGQVLFLGDRAEARAAGIDVKDLPRDGFEMRMVRNGLVLAGRDGAEPEPFGRTYLGRESLWQSQTERATLFALYAFLERYAGVRFYFPGELGTVVPKAERIVVPDETFSGCPDFTVRRYGYSDGSVPAALLKEFGGDEVAFKRANFNRLRMETKYLPCCHGLNKFRYLKRFAKSNPEYFALDKSGRRNTSGSGHIGQICYSSPIAEVIYEDVKAYLTGQPAKSRGLSAWGKNVVGDTVDIMPQDGMFPCQCAACQRRYDFAKGPNYATEFIWSNTVAIANRLTDEGVKGRITQMAYRPYRSVPKEVEIPDNVMVMVAEYGPWSLADEKVYRKQTDEIAAWTRKLGRKVWLWNYPCKCFSTGTLFPGIPQVSPRAWGTYYKRVAPLVFGAFAESESDRWFYNHLNYYVFSRVCWDNSADVDAILEEYHRLMFGPAAPQMRSLYESLEAKWTTDVAGVMGETAVGPKVTPPMDIDLFERIYSPTVLAGYETTVADALSKVRPGSLEARRIELVREEFLVPLVKLGEEYRQRQADMAAFVVEGRADMEPLVLRHLRSAKSKPSATNVATRVRVWKDRTDLVVRFDCEEPHMDKRGIGSPDAQEGALWNDDCVEIYVNPSGDRRRCRNICVNSDGRIGDASFVKRGASMIANRDFSWDSGATATVEKSMGGWKAEIRIPFAALKGWTASKGRIPMNFCRSRKVDDGAVGTDFSVWGAYVKGFPDVQNYGTVVLPFKERGR